ncbi:MAG: sigma-70 family RNA polymerase sigma factor [Pseudomonadota bacterium]
MQRETEAELMRRVAKGDRGAFRSLLEVHQRPLAAYTRRMLGDPHLADDIVQETFLRMWTQAERYDNQAARLTTWLHNIAHNLCIDSFRKNSRITFTDDENSFDEADISAEHTHQQYQRGQQVHEALKRLPERQRSALLLCHYQGLSNKEAALILDVSVDALESLLARGRRTLKKEVLTDD